MLIQALGSCTRAVSTDQGNPQPASSVRTGPRAGVTADRRAPSDGGCSSGRCGPRSRISFLGVLPRAKLYEELGASRAVVLPSVWEDNGPLIILEAQARARPMIVTDRGGPPEFVRHEETGLIVDPLRIRELAAAIERLASDRELAARLGAGAREHVRREHSAACRYELLRTVYDDARLEAA